MRLELPDELQINTDVITMGVWEEIEDLTGRSYTAIVQLIADAQAEGQAGAAGPRTGIPMRVQRALIYATLKCTSMPDVKFDDLADITWTEVLVAQGVLDADGNPGPKLREALAAAGEGAPDPTNTPAPSSSGQQEA